MQVHPWFSDTEWDKLYDMEAAFKPEVNGELDTQNFMKFDEVNSHLFSVFVFMRLLATSLIVLSDMLPCSTSE